MRRRLVRLLFVLIASALLAPAAIPVAAAPASPLTVEQSAAISASQYKPDSEECAMLKLINDWRKKNGKSALKLSASLGAAAEHHSVEMTTKNYFSHDLKNGVSWSQNITNHGYPTGTYRAENIARGNQTAAKTFAQWQKSSGHNTNMLNSTYKAIGIGRSYGKNATYNWYWTTTFGSVSDHTITC